MTHKIDVEGVQQGLARLDALVETHPELTSPEARARLDTGLEEEGMTQGGGRPRKDEEAQERYARELARATERRGRPRKAEEGQAQIFVRMPTDLVARLDRYAAELAREQPGISPSRSAAIRQLLYLKLDELDAETARQPRH
jgi:transposase